MSKKQGRTFLLLAALAGAALFLCLAACDGEKNAPPPAPVAPAAPAQVVRQGIGPEGAGEGSLMYEEEPFPGFGDYINQVDYALSRAVELSGLSMRSLEVSQGPLLEHAGHFYHPQTIVMHGVSDIPAMTQALRDSLLAWAERAAVMRAVSDFPGARESGAALQIEVDGVITHYIFLSPAVGSPAAKQPRLVIVIDDLGESKRHARRILALDYPVTFAVWPHSTHAAAVANLAREGGAELIIHQPMEPEGYPRVNPGQGVILENMSAEQIRTVLDESFRLVPGAMGLNNHMGSRLTQNEAVMRLVSQELSRRGVMALDSLTHAKSRFSKAASEAGILAYKRDIFLDVEADKQKILAQLKKAEQVALVKGQAVAIGHPLAATLEALDEWQTLRNPAVQVVRLKDLTPIAPFINLPGNKEKN